MRSLRNWKRLYSPSPAKREIQQRHSVPGRKNVAEIWRYSVSEHYPRGNQLPSCHRSSDWIHFPYLDGRRAYNIYSRSSNPETDRFLQATPVGHRGDTLLQRGALQGHKEVDEVQISTEISDHHEIIDETIRKAIKTILVSIFYRIPVVWYRNMTDYVIRMLNHTPKCKDHTSI